MVRTKQKKAKGDSAFTKKTQKVGRKKLAPATATRAEVHARTLRLATSAAMTAAMAAPHVADPAAHPPSSATTTAGMKAAREEDQRKRSSIAVQNFAELLSGTRHYKAAQRAASFATLTRLLTAQKKAEAAATARAAGTRGTPSSAFDEYMRYAAAENASTSDVSPAGKLSAAGASGGISSLTALEKLKAFAAALEAITDTDDEVRRGALQSLEVLVDAQWISPDRNGMAGNACRQSSSSPLSTAPSSAATTQDAVELAYCNALLLDLQAGHTREAERVLASSSSTAATATVAPSTVSADRVQAILQSVHVALTHALKVVRLSGVELLALLLRVTPPALMHTAARAVCRHQTAYHYRNPVAMSSGLTMAGVQHTSKRSPAGDQDTSGQSSSPAASARELAESAAAAQMEEEEKWILTLIRRVSSLVLRTKHVGVLPALLSVFLSRGGDATLVSGEPVMADLLRSCLDERCVNDGGRGAEQSAATTRMTTNCSRPVWRHPELVNHFFEEIAPQWANHWKELMELRLELLRQEANLAAASALARSFAVVLVFLKRHQQQKGPRSDSAKGNNVNFFSRHRMYYIKALFIEKIPVTMQELLMPLQGGGGSSSSTSAAGSHGMRARLELSLALVMVCVPLAGTDEGWHLIRDYFSMVFSLPRKSQSDDGESSSPTSDQPFRFPSVALLETSVRLYEQVLRLYPCTASHVRLADEDDEGTVSGSTAASPRESALWGEPITASAPPASQHTRSRENESLSPSSASRQLRHSTVSVRLLSLFPALLNTVIKHVVPRTESAGAASSEDAALARTLLCTSQILERLAALPDDLLRGRKTSSNRHAPNSQAKAGDGSTVAKKLEEGFGLVPRLLFALREQATASSSTAVKRPRADEAADAQEEEGEARTAVDSAASQSVETRVGVLLAYPGIVDALVRRLLRVLWFLISSGHPLLTSADRSGGGGETATPPPLARLFQKSIPFLFGHAQAGVTGVLQRCAVPTVLLAHSILYYLGDAESIAITRKEDLTGEATALEEAAARWADTREVMSFIRA
ncbi:hypothetical protein ABL78_3443 [Leptomonas seymouri]|uniref:Uncharacterized protein n=1 Tax=Leptomonas seymouri TaxID=5684 RepID=A0A0N1PCR4_LEPSE|nr:hypothetical protein ABL78_3443 [Leptomonas seymouri]|eukprot:KPI87454.1 hypothetical protein ABL78_3443 [Leptomonas seymouri]